MKCSPKAVYFQPVSTIWIWAFISSLNSFQCFMDISGSLFFFYLKRNRNMFEETSLFPRVVAQLSASYFALHQKSIEHKAGFLPILLLHSQHVLLICSRKPLNFPEQMWGRQCRDSNSEEITWFPSSVSILLMNVQNWIQVDLNLQPVTWWQFKVTMASPNAIYDVVLKFRHPPPCSHIMTFWVLTIIPHL